MVTAELDPLEVVGVGEVVGPVAPFADDDDDVPGVVVFGEVIPVGGVVVMELLCLVVAPATFAAPSGLAWLA